MLFLNAASELSGLRQTLQALPLRKLLFSLLFLLAGILVVRILMAMLDRLLRRSRLDSGPHRFVKSVVRFILYFVVLVTVADYLGIDVTSLVALLSVASLAISLSVQNVLSNVAGGMMLIGSKPFKKDDYVAIDGEEGTIDEIGLIYTRFHTVDNRSVLMPNAKLSAATIENYSTLGKRRLEQVVSAAYSAEPEVVFQALRKAVERCEPLPETERITEIQEFGDSAISYHVCLWIPSARFIQTRYDLRRYIWEEFRRAGVEMTYPHVNVHLDT